MFHRRKKVGRVIDFLTLQIRMNPKCLQNAVCVMYLCQYIHIFNYTHKKPKLCSDLQWRQFSNISLDSYWMRIDSYECFISPELENTLLSMILELQMSLCWLRDDSLLTLCALFDQVRTKTQRIKNCWQTFRKWWGPFFHSLKSFISFFLWFI